MSAELNGDVFVTRQPDDANGANRGNGAKRVAAFSGCVSAKADSLCSRLLVFVLCPLCQRYKYIQGEFFTLLLYT